jgi:hypothetical protein
MPRQWGKKVRIFDLSGRSSYITEPKAQKLIDAGDAEVLYEVPLTLRIIDKVEYLEELRQQKGWATRMTRPTASTPPGEVILGNKDTRAKQPRHHIPQVERDFQRYKTRLLRNKPEEEAEVSVA